MTGIPHQWLRRRGTPAEFELGRLERLAKGTNLPFGKIEQKFGDRLFGAMNDRWREFVQQLGDGDELWFFSSPQETFPRKLGCMGYAIVRKGIVRNTSITLRT